MIKGTNPYNFVMSLTWVPYAHMSEAVAYDGTNGADIVAYLATVGMTAALLGSGSIACSGGTLGTLPVNSFLIRDFETQDLHWAIWSPVAFHRMFQTVHTGEADLIALGIATVPSLLGGAAVNIDVTIRPTYSDTSYQATAAVSGAVSLLAALSVTLVTIISGSVVRVRVQNTGLLTLAGGQVVVSAIHN